MRVETSLDIRRVELWGPAPIRNRVTVPLDASVIVLYGRNGAGKSRVLKGVHRALNGLGDPGLHGVLHGPGSLQGCLGLDDVSSIGALLARVEPDHPIEATAHDAATSIAEVISTSPGESHRFADRVIAALSEVAQPQTTDDELVVRDLARDALVRLTAIGTAFGQFDVQLVIDPRACSPALSVHFDRISGMCASLQRLVRRFAHSDASALAEAEPILVELSSSVLGRVVAQDALRVGVDGLALLAAGRSRMEEWALGPPKMIELTTPTRLGTVRSADVGLSCLDADQNRPEQDLVEVLRRTDGPVWRGPVPAASPPREEPSSEDLPDVTVTLLNPDGSVEAITPRVVAIDTRELWNAQIAGMHQHASVLVDRAQTYLESMLEDPPRLDARIDDTPAALAGRNSPVAWFAVDRLGSEPLDLDDLSTAQQRWVRVAIALAHADVEAGATPAIVIDEPERALHSAGRRHLAEGLASLTRQAGLTLITASHDAAMLNLESARLFHVQRSDLQGTEVKRLPVSLGEHAEELGLMPADLLLVTRCLLLVEGHHDDVVFRKLLEPELGRARIHILTMGGANQLPGVVDSEFIFDFTDARVVVALDNIDGPASRKIWERASELAAADASEARAFLETNLSGKRSSEERHLRTFGLSAIDRGVTDRLSVCCLGRRDVTEYLPVDALVRGAKGRTWEQLSEKFRKSTVPGSKGVDFKTWLTTQFDADFSDDALRAACEELDEIPADFTDLLDACRGSSD